MKTGKNVKIKSEDCSLKCEEPKINLWLHILPYLTTTTNELYCCVCVITVIVLGDKTCGGSE